MSDNRGITPENVRRWAEEAPDAASRVRFRAIADYLEDRSSADSGEAGR